MRMRFFLGSNIGGLLPNPSFGDDFGKAVVFTRPGRP